MRSQNRKYKMATNNVVVWEWQNEYGQWRPYNPAICSFLESNKNASIPLQLGKIDRHLNQYEADMQNLVQTRLGTGKQNLGPKNLHITTHVFLSLLNGSGHYLALFRILSSLVPLFRFNRAQLSCFKLQVF